MVYIYIPKEQQGEVMSALYEKRGIIDPNEVGENILKLYLS